MLQGLYSWKNLVRSKLTVVKSAVRYIAFLMRQIAALVIGMVAPFYLKYKLPQNFQILVLFTTLTVFA